MKSNENITTTQIAKELKMSAVALNKALKKIGVIIQRGRPSKKAKGEFRKFWSIHPSYLEYGFNRVNPRGGETPTWYKHKKNDFILFLMHELHKLKNQEKINEKETKWKD